MATSNTTRFGFLAIYMMGETPGDRIGAILITDTAGIPREFRCTERIKPTRLQTAVYGATLDDFIAVEIVGKPLLQACTEKPVALFVEDRALLGLRTPTLPVVYIGAGGDEEANDPIDDPTEAMALLAGEDGSQVNPREALERVSIAVDVLLTEDKRFA